MGRTLEFDRFVRLLQEARRRNLEAKGEPPPLTREQARWTRRRFMRATVAAGGAGLAASAFPGFSATAGASHPRVVVVGGGIAGLNAAWQLKKAGIDVTVFEARRRLGGRILTVEGAVGEGLITELGGTFINSDHEDMLALAEEFGVELFDRLEDAEQSPFPRTAYYFEGRRREEEEVAQALRPIAEQITADADRLDADFDTVAAELDQLSVKNYLDIHADKIRDRFIRRLLNGVIRTEYGVEPRQSSALELIFTLPTVEGNRVEVLGASDEKFVVKGGSSQLIEALAEALSGQIERQCLLRRIDPFGPGFLLTFEPEHVVHADYVIIAIPFTTLRKVEITVDLPANLRRFIREARLGNNEKVIAGFSSRPWLADDGFVLEGWTDLEFPLVWDDTQRQVDRPDGALTFYFGGRQARRVLFGDAKRLGGRLVDRLDDFVPGASAAANGRFLRTRWGKDPLTRGAYTSFKPGQLTTFGEFLYIDSDDPEERQDVHVGNLAFAGEHLSDLYYGFMNGGAETGRLAAQVVLRRSEEELATGQASRAA